MATEAPGEAQSGQQEKKMVKQLTGKRDDTPLHSAARDGRLDEVVGILVGATDDQESKQMLSKQNQSGETALYVAAEAGRVEIINELIKCYDPAVATIKARNGLDAFLIAAKQGNLGTFNLVLCEELKRGSSVFSPLNSS